MKTTLALLTSFFCSVMISGCFVEGSDGSCCGGGTGGNTNYGYPPGSWCASDTECGYGALCRQNKCQLPDAGVPDLDPGYDGQDGSVASDASTTTDSGTTPDSGTVDGGGCPYDAGTTDAGTCVLKPKPAGLTCQFNWQCGQGGRCRDGACDRACTATSDCGTGYVCSGGFCLPSTVSGGQCVWSYECPAGWCINGFCHGKCAADSGCANRHDMCSLGVCQQDTRPVPECRSSADCTGGRACVGGACRAECYYDTDCCLVGAGFVCSAGYCVSPHEVAPQCQDNTGCGAALQCIDAVCL